jgi:hypothetical protein
MSKLELNFDIKSSFPAKNSGLTIKKRFTDFLFFYDFFFKIFEFESNFEKKNPPDRFCKPCSPRSHLICIIHLRY